MLCPWQFFSPRKLGAISCTASWEAWFLLCPWKQKQPCSLDLWGPYWHDAPRCGWRRCAQVERPPEPGGTRHSGNKIFHPQVVPVVKTLLVNAEDIRDGGSIPGWERFSGGGHGNPLQHSCLENPMDRGAWQATVRGVTKSQTRLKQLSMPASVRP